MNIWKQYGLIVLVSFLPLIEIFLTSAAPHTSDGEMHMVRFVEYFKEVTSGQFPVRWASNLYFGYGTPLFNFTYPLPYLVAFPFIALGISTVFVFKMSLAFTYIIAGLGMFLLSKKIFRNVSTALFVAIMYQFAPFRLVEMLVRGSLGSMYAYMLLPIVLYSILSLLQNKTRSSFILLSFSTCCLLLSHTIIGYIFFGLCGVFTLVIEKKVHVIVLVYISLFAGALLGAFFILPALLESKYINGYLFTKNIFYDHFPALYQLLLPNITNTAGLRVAEVSVQIGFFHLLALFSTSIMIVKRSLTKEYKKYAIFAVGISAITLLFMQPISKPIWESVFFIRQFQYPWRLLAVIAFTSSFASGFIVHHYSILHNKLVLTMILGLVILSTIFYWRPYQGYKNYSEKFFWNYPYSTNYMSEVNSIWMGKEPNRYPKKRIEIMSGKAQISKSVITNIKHSFTLNAQTPTFIVDRTFFFPGWKVFIDGVNSPIQFQDTNYQGLITFSVSPGKHNVIITFTQSKIQQLGNFISILSLCFIIILIFLPIKISKNLRILPTTK